MNNLSGEATPRVTITHHYDDVLQQILAEVKGLREDLQPKPIVVRNAMNIPEGVSPQAVIQRVEEAERRASKANPPTPPSLPVDDASFELADGRDDHRQDRGEVPVSVTSALLACLYQSLVQRGGDGHVGGEHIGEGGTELFRGGRGAGPVAEVAHDSSPSSGCGDTTVGDAGGPGSRIGEPGPHRRVLDEYMRVFDAEPRDYSSALELPLDEHARRAFGIGRHDYNRYAAGLADALDIPHGSASAVLDGLALVAGGAQ